MNRAQQRDPPIAADWPAVQKPAPHHSSIHRARGLEPPMTLAGQDWVEDFALATIPAARWSILLLVGL